MKKLLPVALAIVMLISCSAITFADSTTTLTTTVPAATYILHIPADQEIPFGNGATDIGSISVSDSTGFASGKNLKLTVTHDDFISDDVETTIPYTVELVSTSANVSSGLDLESESAIFYGNSEGNVSVYPRTKDSATAYDYTKTMIKVRADNWGKALAGNYSSVLTFTTEVVVK